jgi:hypothetical protein
MNQSIGVTDRESKWLGLGLGLGLGLRVRVEG